MPPQRAEPSATEPCRRCGEPEAPPARSRRGAAPESIEGGENRGLAWLVAGFLFCPCHLPLALGMAAPLLAGTAAGVVLRDHLVLAGVIVSLTWLAATWRGLRLLRSARTRAAGVLRRGPGAG